MASAGPFTVASLACLSILCPFCYQRYQEQTVAHGNMNASEQEHNVVHGNITEGELEPEIFLEFPYQEHTVAHGNMNAREQEHTVAHGNVTEGEPEPEILLELPKMLGCFHRENIVTKVLAYSMLADVAVAIFISAWLFRGCTGSGQSTKLNDASQTGADDSQISAKKSLNGATDRKVDVTSAKGIAVQRDTQAGGLSWILRLVFLCMVVSHVYIQAKMAHLSEEKTLVIVAVAGILSFFVFNTILHVVVRTLKFAFTISILFVVLALVWHGIDPAGCKKTVVEICSATPPDMHENLVSVGLCPKPGMWGSIKSSPKSTASSVRSTANGAAADVADAIRSTKSNVAQTTSRMWSDAVSISGSVKSATQGMAANVADTVQTTDWAGKVRDLDTFLKDAQDAYDQEQAHAASEREVRSMANGAAADVVDAIRSTKSKVPQTTSSMWSDAESIWGSVKSATQSMAANVADTVQTTDWAGKIRELDTSLKDAQDAYDREQARAASEREMRKLKAQMEGWAQGIFEAFNQ